MLPSRTVENYLKSIYQAQVALPHPGFVPMGQIAGAVGVVPGTATTMVKALAESGLVSYEPYVGCRLTKAGEKLAATVLRRHRLIELFLVKVMGMSWAEVHDEAEQLEHAVSDRLIERMDEMLGHPSADPHGDPIPGPGKTVEQPHYEDLLTCPLHTRVTVTRITDQDPEFLRFIEESELKPGQAIEIEARDSSADSVRVKRRDDRRVTMGARAASKLLVQISSMLLFILFGYGWATAQSSTVPAPATRPFEILDNSFLVEEAFNQEAGVFQNIFGIFRSGSGWDAGVTQEWPLGTQKHQFSYTVPFASSSGQRGLGDIQVHYRYQVLMEGPRRPAFSPRVTVILPSGSSQKSLGNGAIGVQTNLPFSKQRSNVYFHWNGGMTFFPSVDSGVPASGVNVETVTLFTPRLAASGIWRVRPMLHVMVESVMEWMHEVVGPGTTARTGQFTLSPGARGGWNLGDHQLIVGLAAPVTWGNGTIDAGAFVYVSYELPFKR